MLGQLNEQQIKNLLLSHTVGRVGCIAGNKPYIVPVTYIFEDGYIVSQSNEGTKLDMMRKNKNVCFQVDMIVDMANWQSVFIDGHFEELKGKAAIAARNNLYDRIFPLLTSATVHPHEHGVTSTPDDSNRLKPIMYRIKIKSMTGRFEKQ
ncbi:pyridoxamine 5'-phosphate oxidase family protein [Ferruginibacter sp. HRS2-29]|uniref:pyridoxamine 5'-phosphate oxidase family protein n=1 Tax=Ferruginibacter sp. HRS2-29 TaxID=2487334 RepID=UPI0020CEA891|nr:pyridoxamine 5'-phosphate oxidase family protein [Ferruginibacter sp. HRS2-29]MCP9753150.1 pyridoxamine 5'-phosphate oxidase family protein [Ferruginibacter sp. HRS2-29]